MWNDAPGLFEMMMKFFACYDENIKNYSKPFEVACREFLEEILLHYEKCALNHQCSPCEPNYISDENFEAEKYGQVDEIKEENTDEDEMSGVLSTIWNVGERHSLSDFNVMDPSSIHDPPEESAVAETVSNVEEHESGRERTPEMQAETNGEVIEDEIQEVKIEMPSDFSCMSTPGLSSADLQRLEGISKAIGTSSENFQMMPSTSGVNKQHSCHLPSRIVQVVGAGLKRNPTKRCRLCYRERRARRETRYWCGDCPTKPGLCLEPCFRLWHNWPTLVETPSFDLKGPSLEGQTFLLDPPLPVYNRNEQNLTEDDVNVVSTS